MSDIDPMEHLRLKTEHNSLNNKHNDLRQAAKLLCESINDLESCPPEIIIYYRRVCELLK